MKVRTDKGKSFSEISTTVSWYQFIQYYTIITYIIISYFDSYRNKNKSCLVINLVNVNLHGITLYCTMKPRYTATLFHSGVHKK